MDSVDSAKSAERPEAESDDGAQRAPRTSRLLAGEMRLEDGSVIRIRVRNLSPGGLGGKADAPIKPWQRVQVMLTGVGVLAGRIAWVRETLFGMEFDAPIDPAAAKVETPQAAKSEYVVPPMCRPLTDFRRPALKSR